MPEASRTSRETGKATGAPAAATSPDFPKLPTGENGEAVNEGAPQPPTQPPSPPQQPASSRELTEQQRIAIELMIAGRPMHEAAAGAGVTRRTLYTWRHHHAGFRAELARRRADLWDETADRIRALLDPAVHMLEEQMRSRYDQDRYRAARTILRLAKVGPAIPVKRKEAAEEEEEAFGEDDVASAG